jgi:GH15 family glucan-1,4-alpha-glucosidase
LRNTVKGNIKDILNNLPDSNNVKIRVSIKYSLNGDTWTSSTWPDMTGYYQIADIPQGNHQMWCAYDSTPSTTDTTDFVEKYACIYPGIDNIIDFRLTVSFP